MVMHGHDVSEEEIRHIAEAYRVNVMITGHTHIRKYEKHNETIYLNPGSIGVPKGDGIPTLAVYEDGEIKFINIENGELINI
jgi:putative phosphoesterase